MVICLKRGADLHITQQMPLPLIVSCFSKIQISFSFLVPAHSGSPEQRAVKRVFVCMDNASAELSINITEALVQLALSLTAQKTCFLYTHASTN